MEIGGAPAPGDESTWAVEAPPGSDEAPLDASARAAELHWVRSQQLPRLEARLGALARGTTAADLAALRRGLHKERAALRQAQLGKAASCLPVVRVAAEAAAAAWEGPGGEAGAPGNGNNAAG